MLTLALLRHAKSSWDDAHVDDFDRPLNDRGRAAAPLMGAALNKMRFVPHVILCSSARRTRETLHLALPCFGADEADVVFDDRLYLTSPETLLERIMAVPRGTTSVLLIGHNPGMHALALMLLGKGDEKSVAHLTKKFPTAALAIFSFPRETWSDIGPASGHLEAFVTPRDVS
jgi:phosphohistidine phosphatase